MEHVLLFRNVAVTTDYSNFFPVLKEYGSRDRLSRRELCECLGLSSGQSDRIFHDAKLLGLLDAQLCITSLGRQWERDVRMYGRPSQETLRRAGMNVPLFATTAQELPGERDPVRIFEHFRQRTGPETRTPDLGCARRRYLEAFFPQPLPRSLPRESSTSTEVEHSTQPQPRPPAAQTTTSELPRAAALVTQYLRLMEEFGSEDVAACHAYLYRRK
jgi:hypothetical protein